MMSLKEIKEMFENKNIQFYEVEIPVEKIKNGIRFYDLSSFYEFVHKQKIDVVFGFEYYDEPYSYLITDDIIERIVNQYTYFNIIDIIKKDIEKHNQEILKFNFNNPFAIFISCNFNGQFCYVHIENKDFDENVLLSPREKLEEILYKNEEYIQKREIENQKIIDELKKQLKNMIVDDDKFWLCTNKSLRKNYIVDLIKNRLTDDFIQLKNYWSAPIGVYRDAIDFIEIIWKQGK